MVCVCVCVVIRTRSYTTVENLIDQTDFKMRRPKYVCLPGTRLIAYVWHWV